MPDGTGIPNLVMGKIQTHFPLSIDHRLLIIVQHNVLRAVLKNIFNLHIDLSFVSDDNAISPFNPAYRMLECGEPLPPSLEPTKVQKFTSHHPWIDLFPFPDFRDLVISAENSFDETELCADMVGMGNLQANGRGPGMIVWGPPERIESWEISRELFEKWRPLFSRAKDILEATNMRRRSRREHGLA